MAKNDPYAALRIKEFNIFLLVRFALVFGWSMQFVVIEWQVYSLTQDPLSLGIIGLCEFVPAFLLAPFAGHIVDKKEKRNLFTLCIALFSIISFGLFWLTTNYIETSWKTNTILYGIYGLVFFGGILRAFFGPTIFSLIALIVPKKIYPNAATWSSSTWKGASVFGALSGGLLIAWIGVNYTLGIIFLLVVIAFTLVFQIKKKPILYQQTNESVKESLKAGLQFVFSDKVILGALTLDMIAVLFGGAVAIFAVFAKDILDAGPKAFGLLNAALSSGSILTMFATTYLPITKNTGKKLLIAVFGFGVCMMIFGASKVLWLSLVALFLSGVFDGVSMVIRQTILQIKTPDAMRGRVGAVNSMFVGSSNELGALESGIAARIFGAPLAVILGGAVTLLTVTTISIKNKSLRDLDLRKDIADYEIGED
ncbi:putative MFS family arabinose efflux permease [Winogradskyella epiphytica]|uniref:Putative MFS family arabinose efflux permease n=1 Tax=Winogradskyella epiphytica TaxID=262005 RepID=A0A2V4YHJ3_9FLAO|nr:MFS transporter [Winogradskyella epiphytica]PYE83383.1 putative MFS family arabinose efflux permease [Winogradskyella epiphytica]GGW57773.1 MFS transporter [Winogradskyella epiphytica]